MGMMIIKTKKMSAREVKKKLHDFIDGISEDCGPEIEGMAEELKAHGDEFVDALSGERADYRDGGTSYRGRPWHREGESHPSMRSAYRNGPMYRNEGTWEEREELRKRNEVKLQELDRQLQEMRQQMMSGM